MDFFYFISLQPYSLKQVHHHIKTVMDLAVVYSHNPHVINIKHHPVSTTANTIPWCATSRLHTPDIQYHTIVSTTILNITGYTGVPSYCLRGNAMVCPVCLKQSHYSGPNSVPPNGTGYFYIHVKACLFPFYLCSLS